MTRAGEAARVEAQEKGAATVATVGAKGAEVETVVAKGKEGRREAH